METEARRRRRHIDSDHEDRISALSDDVLLLILQRLDLLTAVRAGALARRWRRLPRLLPDLDIDVATLLPHRLADFSADHHVMAAYTDATAWFLLPPPDTQHHITSLRLAFYLADGPYLRTIGDAVAATTADRIELDIRTTYADLRATTVPDIHGRLSSFLTACPDTFARLTTLALHDFSFSFTPIQLTGLLRASHRLQLLSLSRCAASVMEIDSPSSSVLVALQLHCCSIGELKLTRAPKLERLLCDAATGVGTIRFGSVPHLAAVNLSALHLHRYIEDPALLMLSPAFRNLTDVSLCNFSNLDMAWILFLLEAAALLNNLAIQMSPCWFTNGGFYKSSKAGEAPNIVHTNLTSLEIKAYRISKDSNMKHYIGLIRECAVRLKTIELIEQCGS